MQTRKAKSPAPNVAEINKRDQKILSKQKAKKQKYNIDEKKNHDVPSQMTSSISKNQIEIYNKIVTQAPKSDTDTEKPRQKLKSQVDKLKQNDTQHEEKKSLNNNFTKPSHPKSAQLSDENFQEFIYNSQSSSSDSQENIQKSYDDEESYSIDDDEMSDDKAQMRRRIGKVSFADKGLVRKLSCEFTIQYKKLKLKEHPAFQKADKKYMACVKSYHQHGYKRANDLKIPRYANQQNKVLESIFVPSLGIKLTNYLVGIVDTFADLKVKALISSLFVKQALNSIGDVRDVTKVSLKLQTIPSSVRLKTATEALVRYLKICQDITDPLNQAWFERCIVPALNDCQGTDINDFSIEDIKFLHSVVSQNRFQDLTTTALCQYCSLLVKADLFCLDTIYQSVGERDQPFWVTFLITCCQYSNELAEFCYQHNSRLITQALYEYNLTNGPSQKYFDMVSKFRRMSPENLKRLAIISIGPMFDFLFALMQIDQPQDFDEFDQAITILSKYTSYSQKQQMKETLPGLRLNQWNEYEKVIHGSDNYVKADEALVLIKKAFDLAAKVGNFSIASEDTLNDLKVIWKPAFDMICQKKKLNNLSWQAFIAQQLYYISKKEGTVMVALGTGHGKSCIIQGVSNMKAAADQKVIVVCLNVFLAFWAKNTYASGYFDNDQIQYVSLNRFIRMVPEPDTLVIIDEIDQMLSETSFTLEEEDDHKVRCFFLPELLAQWKRIIGFSGTVSESTAQQLRFMFPGSKNLMLPSLRNFGSINKICKVIKINSFGEFAEKVVEEIIQRSGQYKNFIVLCEDIDVVNQIEPILIKQFNGPKQIITIKSYDRTPSVIAEQLRQLKIKDFIALTTKEGGIAVDYQGTSPAFPIIGSRPKNSSQAIQSAGRGGRDMISIAEATLICANPLTLDHSAYIEMLQTKEKDQNAALKINNKIAKLLHGKVFDKQLPQFETITLFKRKYDEFYEFGEDHENDLMWYALKALVDSEQMPKHPYDRWIA